MILHGCTSHSSPAQPQEFAKHDTEPGKHNKVYNFIDARSGTERSCSVRHEAFLASEVFFRPDFISDEYTTPLPQVQW